MLGIGFCLDRCHSNFLSTTDASRVFGSKVAEKGAPWAIPESPLLGKGVCERRGLFWQPARRAPAKGGGLEKGLFAPPPPDIYFFLHSNGGQHIDVMALLATRHVPSGSNSSFYTGAHYSPQPIAPPATPSNSPAEMESFTPQNSMSVTELMHVPVEKGATLEKGAVLEPASPLSLAPLEEAEKVWGEASVCLALCLWASSASLRWWDQNGAFLGILGSTPPPPVAPSHGLGGACQTF